MGASSGSREAGEGRRERSCGAVGKQHGEAGEQHPAGEHGGGQLLLGLLQRRER